MTAPRIITEPLGGGALALAAQRGECNEWYLQRPRGTEAWREYLGAVAAGHATSDWTNVLAPALNAVGVARARLTRVVEGNGVVVSTGQQAALFGGPLYTLHKALSALAIADELQRITRIPTVPVFWAATDDADYDEANWAAVAEPGGLRKLRLPPLERTGVPMSEVPMPGIELLSEELAAACGAVLDSSALDIIRQSYTSRATLGVAYLQHLRSLLQPLGIAVLDASHPAVRRAAAPIFSRALRDAQPVERALRVRYAAIEEAGYTPQVEHIPKLSLVFVSGPDGEKRRIPVDEADELEAVVDVTALGPNVLLRPIVERFIMPSAAYVAGPGEIAYFAQLSAVAGALDAPMPLVLPRWSATIIEPRVGRLLEKLGATQEELREPFKVERRLARDSMPSDVSDAFRQLRQDMENGVDRLQGANGDNLIPAASVEGLRRSLSHHLDRAERRFLAAVKRRETNLMRDIATVVAALYPEGARQERMLNFVPYLARYGAPFLDAMRAEADAYAAELIGPSASRSMAHVAHRV